MMPSASASAADPFLILLAALMLVPAALAVCLRLPSAVSLGFVALLCAFSSSTWGQLQEENTLYARGTGLFFFSVINLLLWLACAAAAIRHTVNQQQAMMPSPFPKFLAAFSFMLLGHLALGLIAEKPLPEILSYSGLINVLNMLLFSVLLLMTLNQEKHRRRLLLVLLTLAAVRAIFGLVRYAFFGGDSANPYRNFENLDIRLVYFDIGDNYIAALAAFCLAWLLLMPGVRMSLAKRLLLWGWLVAEIATVVLSFRRSSLIGLSLMFAVLMWRLPWQRRLLFGALGALALIPAAATLMQQRLQFNTGSKSFISSLLFDIGPNRGTDVSRFYELEAAARSLDGYWLFGLGSWGTFYGNEDILDYHFGKFDFIHSGFGHLILKSGVVGLLIFLGLLAAFNLHYLRHRRQMKGNSALLADAGFAGLLFWMPTLLIGTPVIEFRTMLLLGLTLSMPYIAHCTGRQRTSTQPALYAAA